MLLFSHSVMSKFVDCMSNMSMDYSTPGFPILHHLLEFAQIHVHWVAEAIQPSHPLSSPFPPIFNLFQHQGLFQMSWLFTSGGQNWSFSFSISPSNEYTGLIPLVLTGLISLLSKGLQESSPTPHFKGINSSALSFLYGLTLTSIRDYWKNHSFD